MKRLTFGIALALLPACVVGSPVAEEQKSAEQQLRDDIAQVCDKGCQENAACGFDTAMDCPTHCSDYLDAFVGHGDECQALGRGLVDCVAKLETCDDYAHTEDCDVPQEQHAQCAAGSTVPAAAVYCEDGGGTSSGMAPSSNGDPATTTSCDLYMQGCSDGAEYRVSCHAVDETLVCNCFRDGIVSGVAFTPVSGACPADGEINGPCGWNLQY
jgi:hypothetical protein